MRSSHTPFKKVKALFNHEAMLQLFIKFGKSELSEDEQKKINKWVHAYQDRELMFDDLKRTIDFQKQLSVAKESDVNDILKNLKTGFPKHFSDIPDDIYPFVLLRALTASVSQLNLELCYAIVYGNRWIRVIALSVRVTIIVLVVLITYEFLFRR